MNLSLVVLYGVDGQSSAATTYQPSSDPTSLLTVWAYREGTREQMEVKDEDEDEEDSDYGFFLGSRPFLSF